MTVHVEFVKHERSKYRCTDYTFIDRHTSEEIAFGSYHGAEGFELIDFRTAGVEMYVSAAVAWTALNRKLIEQYGY